jgi:C4-dicarboxylate-specific signal transduction histidine kinase
MTAPAALNPDWLERVNRLAIIATLVPGTVHDVNNALQVISGSAELLGMAGGGSAENVTRRGLSIGEQAKRATGALGELTHFVRDAVDAPQRLGLRSVAERALVLRQHALRKAKIEAAIDGEDVLALANARHVLQIVLNLLLNAEAALSGRSPATVRITTSRRDGAVAITLTDSGGGIADDRHATLFAEPDTRGSGLPERLGLGLFVSSTLAGKNGGRLSYAPAPGGGASFTLKLPAG